MEAEEAKYTEVIFSDALQRISDEADVPVTEIVQPTEIIEHLTGPWICGQGVDGEIPPRRVRLPVIGKRDRGPTAIGRQVQPKRRHFDGVAVANRGNGSMINPGGDCFDSDVLEALDNFVRTQPCRQIDIVDRKAQQFVAYSTAHVARQTLVASKRIKDARHSADCSPLRRIEP